MFRNLRPWQAALIKPSSLIFAALLIIAWFAGRNVSPVWSISFTQLDVTESAEGIFTVIEAKKVKLEEIREEADSTLTVEKLNARAAAEGEPPVEYIRRRAGDRSSYFQKQAHRHWGIWSLFPAFTAILLCWITRDPLISLLSGAVSGGLLMRKYNTIEEILLPAVMTKNAAGILILYMVLLGALMGIWSKTGGAHAFADAITRRFVTGPRSAKLVAWILGVIFFQGGTISTVLVGTTVKPIADKEKISHEELSFIVDATASPIAGLLAFNAWPGYIQAFLFVGGVSFLATETDRLGFFFKSVIFSFYCMLMVSATFLVAIEKMPMVGGVMRRAIRRSRETGELDAPDSQPLSAPELEQNHVPPGYRPHQMDFLIPIILLIGIAIASFLVTGIPEIRIAFSAAVLAAGLLALLKGMRLHDLMLGVGDGLKGVVLGAVVLLFAITIGLVTQESGGGLYMVELLGNSIPFWLLPVTLQLITMVISFSTGTSWGTYAVAFPLAMPLAWSIATASGLHSPEIFMMICFAVVLNGSIFGDQCSPISDTTVLSAMCTGCDLMDHVRTQMPIAIACSVLAGVGWTVAALVFCG